MIERLEAHNRENETDKSVGEECDEHGDEIPFDDHFCLSGLLRIATREDEIVSCNKERDPRNNRDRKEEELSDLSEKIHKSSRSLPIGAIHISRMEGIELAQIQSKSWAGEIILSLCKYEIRKEIHCDDKEKTKHGDEERIEIIIPDIMKKAKNLQNEENLIE